MSHKTTKRHFELFKKECTKWIVIFGLVGWEIAYKHIKLTGVLACCEADIEGRWATISLADDWGDHDSLNDEEVKVTAFHEVCELLLWRLRHLGTDRYIRMGEMMEEIHAVIRTLENVIYRGER